MAEPEFTTEELESEEWRDVVGYEGWYSISSLGRLRRDVSANGTHAGRIAHRKGGRYIQASLAKHGQKKYQPGIHQLVAAAFIGPCPAEQEVNHKDGVKHNNRVGNLEYTTQQGNSDHARLTGLIPRGVNHHSYKHPERIARGEHNGEAKLTNANVILIRMLVDSRQATPIEMAQRFQVTKETIYMVVNRKTWTHL